MTLKIEKVQQGYPRKTTYICKARNVNHAQEVVYKHDNIDKLKEMVNEGSENVNNFEVV